MSDYLYKMINEGFNINRDRSITHTDIHQKVLNTSLNTKPVISKIYSDDLRQYITVYSIFKRVEQTDIKNDSNSVLYALKGERHWHFSNPGTRKIFWNRFSDLLKKFLEQHKNKFETTIVIPSSNSLNNDIINEIKLYAKNVGIQYFVQGTLRTVKADNILDSVYNKKSPFYKKYYNNPNIWDEKIEKLEDYIQIMNNYNNGFFKYHIIDDIQMRKLIINTIEVEPETVQFYRPYINNKNILIVDDSITNGQTIKNAIHAISSTYIPKSVSVLTMFSELYSLTDTEYDDFKGSY